MATQTQTLNEEECKAFLATKSDDDLGAMFDFLAGTIDRAIGLAERDFGMTSVEEVLRRAQVGNGAGMFDLPFDGGKVRDVLPPGYDGFERARKGETVQELELNKIPTKVSFEKKLQIAMAQVYAAADAPDVNTPAGQARLILAVAQHAMLTKWKNGFYKTPSRPSTRDKLIDAVYRLMEFSYPAFQRTAVR